MKRLFLWSAALLLSVSCKEDYDKLAAPYLKSATEFYDAGNYSVAKQYIDSVRTLYPNAIKTRRAALGLMQRIEEDETLKSMAYENSRITEIKHITDSLKAGFAFEKDEKYQDVGIYYVKSQAIDKNYSHNYLRAQVDEKGVFTLISNYSGGSHIHHKQVKVSSGNAFAESKISTDLYEYKDLGVCYEKCNLKQNDEGGVAEFILRHTDQTIKVQLMGSKSVSYNLTAEQKKAISSIYTFAKLLQSLEEHSKNLEEAERKLKFIRERKKEESSLPDASVSI